MVWWRESIPVPRNALVIMGLLAVAGVVFLGVSGSSVPWPNPWRQGDDLDTPMVTFGDEKTEEETTADEAVDKLDSALASLDELEAAPVTPVGESEAVESGEASDDGPSAAAGTGGLGNRTAPGRPAVERVGAKAGAEAGKNVTDEGKKQPEVEKKGKDIPPEVAKALAELGIPDVSNPCIKGTEDKCEARALDSFMSALEKAGDGRKVRILVYGDSLIVGDRVVSTLRDQFQHSFGNGGPGFLYPVKPCGWYGVDGLKVSNSGGWEFVRVTKPQTEDGFYGLGGQAFLAKNSGKKGSITCGDECIWPEIANYELYFMTHKRGGKGKVLLSNGTSVGFDTRSETLGSGYVSVDGLGLPLNVTVEIESGETRLFGMSAETPGGGVVVDNLGVIGARSYKFNNADAKHFGEQLAHRKPDLVLLLFGANESEVQNVSVKAYNESITTLISTIQAGVPGVSILMASPPACGERVDGKIKVRRSVPQLVAVQQQVCAERGVAYWNEYEAMGGQSGAAAWFKKGLLSGDLVHMTAKGGAVMGKYIYAAIIKEYIGFRARNRAQ